MHNRRNGDFFHGVFKVFRLLKIVKNSCLPTYGVNLNVQSCGLRVHPQRETRNPKRKRTVYSHGSPNNLQREAMQPATGRSPKPRTSNP